MKCFNHEEKDATATCQYCGKSLCKECVVQSSPCLCADCCDLVASDEKAQKNLKRKDALIDTNAELIKAIVIGLICSFVICGVLGAMAGETVPVIMRVLLFFVPFGWSLITYIEQWLPCFLLSGPAFVVYLMIKMMVSIMLGIPCFAYQVIKYIVGMTKAMK